MPTKSSFLYAHILAFSLLISLAFGQANQYEATLSDNQTTLPDAVIKEMAKRENRYHHFIWHNIRNNWYLLSRSAQQQIRNLGWAPPNPARRYQGDTPYAITNNLSGEDFLYMHRQMIEKVNAILATNGGTYGNKVTGWTSCPAPGDTTWPVPPTYTVPGQSSQTQTIRDWKATSFYNSNIKPNEEYFKNPYNLRRMSLAELGARLEVTVHGYMHIRFSAYSTYGFRPYTSDSLPDIDKKWDDPRYNWLGDLYAAMVNPAFWKLHGWVDDRIEDWRKANGLSSIRWRGTWVGGPMSNIGYLWDKKEGARTSFRVPGQGGEPVIQDTMQEIGRIFAKEGIESSFADIVLLDVPKKFKSKTGRRLCKVKTKTRRTR